ncbi:MAG TPA: beta-ketoacyl synthase N-terminal-like domain-containing protein, partial [Labilithrix sp.]|nr:beta-ketoacyl synthase N-terminal-like domain-containing protein [Labilithrix sp.]
MLFNHPTVEAIVDYLANEDAPVTTGPLGEILIDTGILSEADLKAALVEQARSETKERLGAVLVRMGLVTADQLHRALSYQLSEPIAIVGLGCRFPGASNPEAFWRLLEAGVDAIVDVPPERWDAERVHDPDPAKKSSLNWGGFVEGIDRFDAAFFGITPREAEEMDPQQRMLLEVASEALDDAGQARDELLGSRTGVFVGITNNNDYVALKRLADDPARVRAHHGTGMASSVAAGRLSYTLGLNGPAMAIDAACASSLVAVHLAMQSLRSGECRMALAGGVNAILSPELSLAYSQAGMLSPTGRCRTFDESADGYVRSEGCGMIVLKRLSDARAHGDNVLALLIGSAVNQNGRGSGLTAPSGTAQQALVRQALASAGVHPSEVGYVEAQGTGTPLGDPIEIQALGEVLKEGRPSTRPFIVGSVKTNIGHLEAAAGIAGLMKVVLSLRHEQIPPHLHLKRLNPLLGAETLPMKIPGASMPWPVGAERRIAGVSAFGFGGTNCHVLVEEAPHAPTGVASEVDFEAPCHVVPVSARTPEALATLTERYAEHFASHPDLELADVSYTAGAGRSHFEERVVVTASSLDEARERLKTISTEVEAKGVFRGHVESGARPRIAFLFTGEGSQYSGMGRTLYETQPVFRNALERCASLLEPHLSQPLLSVLYPKADEEPSSLSQTGYTQPALFAVEYALSELWRSWGVVPEAVLGHGVGEYVAACVAGIMSLEDALRLIAVRGRLMQTLSEPGAMASVGASDERVRSVLNGVTERVSIAAMNAPEQVVVSGHEAAVLEACAALGAKGIQTERLDVSHAFHSALMEPMLDEFERILRTMTLESPKIALASGVTGRIGGDELATSDYWRRHAREPVRFADGIRTLRTRGIDTFLEIGPQPILLGMGTLCVPGHGRWLPSLRKQRSEWEVLLESVAQLHVDGATIDWDGFHRPYARSRVPLPTYAWQKQRYWIDTSRSLRRSGQETGHPLLGVRVPVAGAGRGRRRGEGAAKVFETVLSTTGYPYLADHVVLDKAVVPAAAHLELARAASEVYWGAGPHRVRGFVVQSPLVLSATEARRVQVVVSEEEEEEANDQGDDQRLPIAVYSQPVDATTEDGWVLHARGHIQRQPLRPVPPVVDLEALKATLHEPEDVALTYETLHDAGFHYGPAFRAMTLLLRGERSTLARVASALPRDGYGIHPVLLDAGLHALVSLFRNAESRLYLPFEISDFTLWNSTGEPAWVHATTSETPRADVEVVSGALTVLDEAGQVLAEITDIKLKRTDASMFQTTVTRREALYQLVWREMPRRAPSSWTPRGAWIVLTDGSEVGSALASRLEAAGVRCFAMRAPWSGKSAWEALLAEAIASGDAIESVVCFWRGRSGAPDQVGEATAVAGLEVVQSLVRTGERMEHPPRLWWVTEGSQCVRRGERSELATSPIWGLGRTVMQEHPELGISLVDLEPNAPDALQWVWDELGSLAEEPERALRGGHLFVPRLAKPTLGLQSPDGPNYHLRNARRGQLDALQLVAARRRAPASGEVEIEVEATGLNFRDVVNALGMYPGEVGALGLECAGVVTAVGERVAHLSPGDRVMALAPAAFSRFVTVDAGFAVRTFEGLSSAESAALPVAFLTAYHAFSELARLKAGERVLIHAAAGGVGMAAVQIAKWIGAEVFATASPSKWHVVRALGVEHLASSRTLDFADTFRQATGGRGVDVVLNALAGDFTDASLGLLRPGGRFLELGKADLRDPSAIAAAYPGISYQAFDLLSLDSGAIAGKLRALADAFSQGKLSPLPIGIFPIADAEAAFRTMAQARHTGKLVLTAARAARSQVSPDSSALITGGLATLGLRIAEWLIKERHVAHVVLMGPSAPSSDSAADVDRLRGLGAKVTIAQGDVANPTALRGVLEAIPRHLPLRTVI